jgi:diguanylate cyclase (GGDEF)-like protein
MKDDIRYSEFKFLREIEKRSQIVENFYVNNREQQDFFGVDQMTYLEMAVSLAEDLYIVFEQDDLQFLIGLLRGEILRTGPLTLPGNQWEQPRTSLRSRLLGQTATGLRITFRGRRHLAELRDLLKYDRILEPFGVLLSLQYVRKDVEDALRRAHDFPVSVLYADMDDFGKINKKFGQAAGDVVMEAYLKVVRDSLEPYGSGYRGLGDETVGLVLGQGHARACELAERIRIGVEALKCEYDGRSLPQVTASIGVATSPPAPRTMDVEAVAEDRKRQAKDAGKNRVIAS